MTLIDDLSELSGKPLTGKGYRLAITKRMGRRRPKMYVSGVPYEVTSDVGRAFVFDSEADAKAIQEKHFAGLPFKIIPG